MMRRRGEPTLESWTFFRVNCWNEFEEKLKVVNVRVEGEVFRWVLIWVSEVL